MRLFVTGLILFTFTSIPFCKSLDLYITAGSQSQLESIDGMGGIEAYAGFFDEVVHQATPYIIIEAGSFLPARIHDTIDLTNADIYSKAMGQLPYHVVCLSVDDLRLGATVVDQIKEHFKQAFLVSNVVAQNETSQANFVDTTTVEINGITIGFVSLPVLDQALLIHEGDYISEDPNEVSTKIDTLKEDEKVDIVVLISKQPPVSVLGWFSEYEGTEPDLMISQNLDIRIQKPKGVWMSNAPANSKSVAKVSLKFNEDKTIDNVEYQRVEIDSDIYYSDTIRDFLFEHYEAAIDQHNLYITEPYPLMDQELEQNYLSLYAGADKCMECHQDIYDQWAGTKHATAFDELLKTNRHWVPEQMVYRVTGYGHNSGFKDPVTTPHLTGVQCETCHGPGQIHIDEFGTGEIRRGESKNLCMECHTTDWDPEFDELFDLYYEQIKH